MKVMAGKLFQWIFYWLLLKQGDWSIHHITRNVMVVQQKHHVTEQSPLIMTAIPAEKSYLE
jgi:hypothetical protein